jgi:microcystin-dependent protein
MDAYLASIIMFGGNFDPLGWEYCNGQELSIQANSALFSLLGTTYGGNGQTTFQLPDMRGRVPMHPGAGSGLSRHSLGEKGGVETVTPQLGTVQTPKGTEQAITTLSGTSKPQSVMQPYLCVNFIICTDGIYPSRK